MLLITSLFKIKNMSKSNQFKYRALLNCGDSTPLIVTGKTPENVLEKVAFVKAKKITKADLVNQHPAMAKIRALYHKRIKGVDFQNPKSTNVFYVAYGDTVLEKQHADDWFVISVDNAPLLDTMDIPTGFLKEYRSHYYSTLDSVKNSYTFSTFR